MDIEVFDFGLQIKKLRRARNLSQAALAKKLGVSKESVYRYESNTQTPSFETMIRLALVLDTPLDNLAGLEKPHSEQLELLMHELGALSESECAHLRKYIFLMRESYFK